MKSVEFCGVLITRISLSATYSETNCVRMRRYGKNKRWRRKWHPRNPPIGKIWQTLSKTQNLCDKNQSMLTMITWLRKSKHLMVHLARHSGEKRSNAKNQKPNTRGTCHNISWKAIGSFCVSCVLYSFTHVWDVIFSVHWMGRAG